MIDRQLCGWRVRSAIALPELPAWPDDDRPVDIRIGPGAVPPALADLLHDGPVLQIGRDGSCRFALPAVGAFLLRGGREIIVDAAEGVPEADLRVFLLGSLFGLLCHQRGLLPLHASAVLIDGAAVAFTGPSGIGKSTLAAAFAAAGYPVVADDVLVVDPSVTDRPTVRPALLGLRLWRQTLDGLGMPTTGLRPARAVLDKFAVPMVPAAGAGPLPLAALFHLEAAGADRMAGCEPLKGLTAISFLRDAVYRAVMADCMGLTARLAADVMRIAPGLRLHARLRQVPGFDRLPASVASISALVGEAMSDAAR